jgi:hypothetical protein
MLFVNFPLLGHDGEERLRIRLLVAGEEGFCVLPAPSGGDERFLARKSDSLSLADRRTPCQKLGRAFVVRVSQTLPRDEVTFGNYR